MKHVDKTSPHKPSGTDWWILGELELRIDQEANELIRTWIRDLLGPLNVNSNLEEKILNSAQEAVARARQSTIAALKFGHIYLLVFSPADALSDGHSWGFFRIEKFESTAPSKSSREHAIELYLYLEGQ